MVSIFKQRNEIIASDDVSAFVSSMSEHLCSNMVQKYINPNSLREDWQIDELSADIHRTFAMEFPIDELAAIEGAEEEISTILYNRVNSLYEKKLSDYGQDLMNSASKYLLLTTLDQVWKEHLHNLDYLRQGISLRAYGQKDPLNEYKREAFGLFEGMLDSKLSFRTICCSSLNM